VSNAGTLGVANDSKPLIGTLLGLGNNAINDVIGTSLQVLNVVVIGGILEKKGLDICVNAEGQGRESINLNRVALHASKELGDVAHDWITDDDSELAPISEVVLTCPPSYLIVSVVLSSSK
jgi:hypothetical protein